MNVNEQHKHQQHVLVEVQQCGGRVEAQVEQRRQQQEQHCNDWKELLFWELGLKMQHNYPMNNQDESGKNWLKDRVG